MHHRDGPDTERAAAHKVAPIVTGRRREVLEMLASMERGSGTDIAKIGPIAFDDTAKINRIARNEFNPGHRDT